MQKMYFAGALTLTVKYPQILDLIKTLPLYYRQWLGNRIHSQAEKKEAKKKHLKHSLPKSFPKPHLYISLLIFLQPDS